MKVDVLLWSLLLAVLLSITACNSNTTPTNDLMKQKQQETTTVTTELNNQTMHAFSDETLTAERGTTQDMPVEVSTTEAETEPATPETTSSKTTQDVPVEVSTTEAETEPATPETTSIKTTQDMPVEISTTEAETEPATPETTSSKTTQDMPVEVSTTEVETTETEAEPAAPETTKETDSDEEMESNYKLIVDGCDITQGNYIEFVNDPAYAALPFTAVMRALGAEVEWKSDNVAEIIINEEKYLLNAVEATLFKDGSNFNCIIPAPGSAVYHKFIGHEFVLDDITTETVAEIMGILIRIDIDYQNHTVEINYQ